MSRDGGMFFFVCVCTPMNTCAYLPQGVLVDRNHWMGSSVVQCVEVKLPFAHGWELACGTVVVPAYHNDTQVL